MPSFRKLRDPRPRYEDQPDEVYKPGNHGRTYPIPPFERAPKDNIETNGGWFEEDQDPRADGFARDPGNGPNVFDAGRNMPVIQGVPSAPSNVHGISYQPQRRAFTPTRYDGFRQPRGNMEDLMNIIRREVHRVVAQWNKTLVGTVSSYDPDQHAAKVLLQPEGIESGWIPIGTQHIGNGFGVMVGLEIGDQVEIGFQQGDQSAPRIIGRFHSEEEKPPRVEAGEVLLKHKSGSTIFFDKSGNVHIKSNGSLYVNGSGETP